MSDNIVPNEFLEVIVHDATIDPTLLGLCAGYELSEWRAEQFADHLFEWLPEFCLNWSEIENLGSGNCVRLIKQAAKRIYDTDDFIRRGEFGEVLIHAVLRQEFDTLPAVSKIYYKDSSNDTVKGFDAVHIVDESDALELWLGEAKFYSSIDSAINAVVEELNAHTKKDYLRDEFVAIVNKIEDDWPYSDRLKKLLDPNTSLDEIFDRSCLPVLLTYDSKTTASFEEMSKEYKDELINEFRDHYGSFISKEIPGNLEIHLILVPLNTKEELVEELDKKLKVWQQI